ncbi:hypothetical protein GGI07_004088 [Coemansia sp. Benny D115]|nr:hypothetical protein GGI07_004088 [Coemansia sp. Benny D115]
MSDRANLSAAAAAAVLYYCACQEVMQATDVSSKNSKRSSRKDESAPTTQCNQPKSEEPEHSAASEQQPPLSPSSELLVLRASALENLYYCDDCSQIRCNRCVIEEPAGYHCPNCLFDVPTASVRSEKNCCARNCFQCPICTHVLAVVENDIQSKPFSLACAVCCWDSREIGWEFEKATGISAQIENKKAGDHCAKEYANLLDHWRTVNRVSSASASTPAQSAALGAHHIGGSFKSRFGGSSVAGLRGGLDSAHSIPVYKAVGYVDVDQAQVSRLIAVGNADTISQLTANPNNIEPQRIRLHMKLARRCRTCHHILIKPESKAQATRFKIQLMAANFLPTISIPTRLSPKAPSLLPELPFSAGNTVPLVLRFSNPLYTEMQVSVSAHASEDDAHVNVLAPRFVLPPFTELWEYDEGDDDGDDSDDSSSSNSKSTGKQRGIVDRQGNRVAIQLNATPKRDTDVLTIPLCITCTHKDDMDMDVEDSASAPGGDSGSPRRVVTNVFWVYVSFGSK